MVGREKKRVWDIDEFALSAMFCDRGVELQLHKDNKGWNSERTSLKPFSYPVPETRFIHAGMNVYKFKIKYGNTISTNIDLHENIVNKELEEAIRVILGNLNNLHPFTTEHLVIFPYLSKWEKASDLRFKRGDAFLSPYPYVCIVYTELNSRQKRLSLDKTECRGAYNFADNNSRLCMYVDTERAMNWSGQECTAEFSHVQLHNDRDVARDAAHIYGTTRPHIGRTRLQRDVINPRENLPEEIQLRYCGAAIVNRDNDNMTLGEYLEYDMAENSDHGQQDGRVPSQGPEEHTEWKKKGFLALLKSILFPPLLQRIFSGISQLS